MVLSAQVFTQNPELFCECDIFTAGQAILFFKYMGYGHEDVIRYLACTAGHDDLNDDLI